MNYKHELDKYFLQYLEKQNIAIDKKSKSAIMVRCIHCKSGVLSAQYVTNFNVLNCFKCHKKFTLPEAVRTLEQDKEQLSDEQIYEYIKDVFNADVETPKDVNYIDALFKFYKDNNFELTPLSPNSKKPVKGEKWSTNGYKEIHQWKNFFNTRLNFAIICGERSGVTIIDIDLDEMPKEIRENMGDVAYYQTRQTGRWQLLYKYEPELGNWMNKEMHIESKSVQRDNCCSFSL